MAAAKRLLSRIDFHYTPKRASCLNMAEMEISIPSHQWVARRDGEQAAIAAEGTAWQKRCNAARCGIV
ncbi:hypothetical protein C4900_06080 [Acidiferrobacter thiooxydans]|uniref:Uncharacterized protein n=1 Tax=Acidiferrobacter thiooxydans TaxID=163359 RepID=A0A368HLU6_9GAMM|nr:hypothetical protein C4900_06080 [Acidiferrobacter thiooxydans]